MKFPTLPIRLWTAFAAALVSAGCARPAFEASWRQTLDNADGGLLRVWSIADRSDSLFLRRRAEPVTARMYAAEEFGRLCEGLLTTVRNPQNEGVGIAAPQVGILRRVCIVEDEQGEIIELINPEIIKTEGEQTGLEGCLSVPGKYGIVTRPMVVRVRAQDRYGATFEVEDEELTARCFCHEIEHLDGHLYTEHCKILSEDELEKYLREQEKELDEE